MVVGVAQLLAVSVQVDQVVGGQRQAIEVLVLRRGGILDDARAVTVEDPGARRELPSLQQLGEDPLAVALDGQIDLRHLLEQLLLPGLDDRPADDDGGAAVGAGQAGEPLQLLDEEDDRADPDDVRLEVIEQLDERGVGRAVERGLHDANLGDGPGRLRRGSHVHEPDREDVHLVGDQPSHPPGHVVGLDQEDPVSGAG